MYVICSLFGYFESFQSKKSSCDSSISRCFEPWLSHLILPIIDKRHFDLLYLSSTNGLSSLCGKVASCQGWMLCGVLVQENMICITEIRFVNGVKLQSINSMKKRIIQILVEWLKVWSDVHLFIHPCLTIRSLLGGKYC